jgi:tellurite resistance protein TehA-like permease
MVMAMGIESVALRLTGHVLVSDVVMWLAVATWVGLAVMLVARLTFHRAGMWTEAQSPPSLTLVAGSCVLGVRLTQQGWAAAGATVLVVAAIGCAALQFCVWRHWRTPSTGAGFLTTVSIESLAVLCGAVAAAYRAPWLVTAGAVLAIAGLVVYLLVLVEFDAGQVVTGWGDQWVAGGALAIAALACANLAAAARALAVPPLVGHLVRTSAPILGILAMVWLPILVAGEVWRPRVSYDVRRWATVFPVAMYAAAGFAVGRLAGVDAIVAFARAWVWVAFVVWALVLTAMLAHGRGWILRRSASAPRRDA